MMAARYSVSEETDLLFDDDFGLSDGYLSEEEGDWTPTSGIVV